jgi:hypothetical protein
MCLNSKQDPLLKSRIRLRNIRATKLNWQQHLQQFFAPGFKILKSLGWTMLSILLPVLRWNGSEGDLPWVRRYYNYYRANREADWAFRSCTLASNVALGRTTTCLRGDDDVQRRPLARCIANNVAVESGAAASGMMTLCEPAQLRRCGPRLRPHQQRRVVAGPRTATAHAPLSRPRR